MDNLVEQKIKQLEVELLQLQIAGKNLRNITPCKNKKNIHYSFHQFVLDENATDIVLEVILH